mmetsp:Transcript_28316/g.58389  ORF Transcript_28316/g.58389 Transcript_28316/m.58389 type:complete len:272 (+) Transcript_28316:32-847(+)
MACLSLPKLLLAGDQVMKCPSSEQALCDLLKNFGIDTSAWGDQHAKPVVSLLRELREGSCSLRVANRKRIYRLVEPVFVQITYCGKVLVERMKIFPNGMRREHRSVLAEKKALSDHSALHAAIRGIREELHVDVGEGTEGLVHSPQEDVSFIEELDSASYPGLPAVYETSHIRLNVQSGSSAERAFTHCGLPACKPFETVEMKLEGELRLGWEWVEFHEALRSKIKGMEVPQQISKRKPMNMNDKSPSNKAPQGFHSLPVSLGRLFPHEDT